MTVYPTVELLILTNKRVMEETKVTKAEKHGLLTDKKTLGDIIKKVKETKGNIYNKAATLLMELTQKHPFESGNRRTAFLATINFLEVNKIEVKLNKDKIENILQGIRERFYTLNDVSKWLQGEDMREFKRE